MAAARRAKVVLLHGQPGTGAGWRGVVAALGDDFDVVAPDRPERAPGARGRRHPRPRRAVLDGPRPRRAAAERRARAGAAGRTPVVPLASRSRRRCRPPCAGRRRVAVIVGLVAALAAAACYGFGSILQSMAAAESTV